MLAQFFKKTFLVIFLTALIVANADATESNSVQFLSLADIHFDPFIACHATRGSCPLILKLRQAPPEEWDDILAKNDKTQPEYRQDSNYSLLKSGLQAAKEAAQKNHAAFVVILGDFLGHDFRKFYIKYTNDPSHIGYQTFVKKTLEFLTQEIANTFPNLDVYTLTGNNDSYHKDYSIDPKGLFFSDTSKLWSALIKTKENKTIMQHNFANAGYYAVNIPEVKQLKLIMLNSVLFSYKAKGKDIEQAGTDELNWLREQLLLAKKNNQKVFIAMHIPAGIDVYATLQYRLFRLIELWQKNYTENFEALLKEFAPEIAGILAGHLHSDWFQLLTEDLIYKIPITGTPAISPIFGNNPGFKVYSYSLNTQSLNDFQTYFYPIDREKSWHVEYDFNQTYQSNCKRCSVAMGIDKLTVENKFSIFYKRFYAVSTDAQPITTKWDPYYRCALNVIDAKRYKTCL